jgi:ubiquinone/menaquinone biosynthesis C-methylase UbiE
VYAYIPRSLARFPNRRSLHNSLQTRHLSVINSRRFMLGLIEVIVCQKTNEPLPSS